MWIVPLGIFAQTHVQGVVLDAEKTPMIGVNIIEKGSLNGTITDVIRICGTNSIRTYPVSYYFKCRF
jgi:hypothetical protein